MSASTNHVQWGLKDCRLEDLSIYTNIIVNHSLLSHKNLGSFISENEQIINRQYYLGLIAKFFLPNKVMLCVSEDVSFGAQIIELQNFLL